jgi:hypothetical protein
MRILNKVMYGNDKFMYLLTLTINQALLALTSSIGRTVCMNISLILMRAKICGGAVQGNDPRHY